MGDIDRRRLLIGAGTLMGAAGTVGVGEAVSAAPPRDHDREVITVRRGDRRYPDLTRDYNNRWQGRPEAVRLPADTDQVVRAVQEAVDGRKRVTVRGGGHCFEDFVNNDEVQTVLDLSLMNRAYYDSARRAFTIEGGAILLDTYKTLHQGWGVTIPAGGCYSVGVGGHISGGGYGVLSRRHGLVVDHLYAVEVVHVDHRGRARRVVATRDPRDPNRDLWWGCAGGGGGNFGVVTRFWLRSRDARGDDPADLLPPSPSEALVVEASWPWSQIDEARFGALLTAYGAWHEAHSDADSPYADLGHWLFLNHASAGGIFLASQIDATVPRAERLIDDFVNYLSAALGVEPDFRNDLRAPFLKATQYSTLGGAVLTNPNFRSEHKSAFMRASFPRRQIEVAYRHLTRTDYENPYGQLVLTSVGGQINRMPSDATASPHRDALLLLLYQNHWTAAAEDGVNVAWLREFFAEMYADTGGVPVPNAVTDGSYINYPDRDLSDPAHNRSGVPWHAFYYKGNYPRLQQVKARWDPGNVFRHRQSIQL